MHTRSVWVFASAALLVSGCLGGSDSRPEPSAPAGTDVTETRTPELTLDVRFDLPAWSVGQLWRYAVELPGRPTTAFRMMVAEDRADEDLWIVATDDRARAVHHAVYSTNPVLGRISKGTLSPYQNGEPVQMFQFPLTDRKTWTASFFGEDMTFVARYDDAVPTLPGVYLPGFFITATGPSGQRVTYNYVEAVGWFSDFQLHDADGAKQIHLTLLEFGTPGTGPYWFFRGRDRADAAFTQSPLPGDEPSFDVTAEDGFGSIAFGLVAENTAEQAAIANVTALAPDGSLAYSQLIVLAPGDIATRLADVPVQEGTWTIHVVIVGPARVEVRAAGLLHTAQGNL